MASSLLNLFKQQYGPHPLENPDCRDALVGSFTKSPPPADASRVFVPSPPPRGRLPSFPVTPTQINASQPPRPPVMPKYALQPPPPPPAAMALTLFSVTGGMWHIPPTPPAHNHQCVTANRRRVPPYTRLRAH